MQSPCLLLILRSLVKSGKVSLFKVNGSVGFSLFEVESETGEVSPETGKPVKKPLFGARASGKLRGLSKHRK